MPLKLGFVKEMARLHYPTIYHALSGLPLHFPEAWNGAFNVRPISNFVFVLSLVLRF